jgi:hypothetical protein
MEVNMRVIMIILICLVGMIVLHLWALGIILVVRSGRGLTALLPRKPGHPWLPIADTIAQYGEDHAFPPE